MTGVQTCALPILIAACALGFLLQFAVTEVPFLIRAFGTSPLSGREWMRLAVLSAAPLFAHEMVVLTGRLASVRFAAVRSRQPMNESW